MLAAPGPLLPSLSPKAWGLPPPRGSPACLDQEEAAFTVEHCRGWELPMCTSLPAQ